MSNVYHDYFKQTVLTIPDTFIDIKTGDQHTVLPELKEEIAYHSENNTLNHLLFSALHHYFLKAQTSQQEGTNIVLTELQEIKRMLAAGSFQERRVTTSIEKPPVSKEMDILEIEDLLEAFGG
ncbi:hypothetical protein GLW00_16435 [Halobacillus litoralis]|uniref:Uncharacterized protein n=1 Tax=Halobacillus litoralis TaxID=45668 RepID=A0A845FFX7_9BACI|nr:hypothetical protein [Halobacillus litoralis]MYL72435.1 hypothetical protein [Halobacillus litoralis]